MKKTLITLGIGTVTLLNVFWVSADTWMFEDMRDQYRSERKTHRQELREERQDHRKTAREDRQEMRETYGTLRSFLQEDLTDDEKETIAVMMKDHHQAISEQIKAFIQQFTETEAENLEDQAETFVAWLAADAADFHESLESYVKEEVLTDWTRDEFISAHTAHFEEHMTQRILYALEGKSLRQQRSIARKHRLTNGQKNLIWKKLSQLWEADMTMFFEKLLERINKKMWEVEENETLTDTTRQRLLDLLAEIGDVVENELAVIEIEDDLDETVEEELEE